MRAIWVVLAVAGLGQAARADCAGDIAALEPRVAAVPQKTERVKLTGMLERARRELMENDETECGWAVSRVKLALPR